MNDIVIFAKKTKLLGLGLVCLVFEAIFVIFFVYGFPDDRESSGSFVPVVLIIGALMFGAILIYVCFRLLNPAPVVIINREGIVDNASAFSAGLIHWYEIRTMFVYQVVNEPMLGIVPFDTQPIIARQSPVKRFFFKLLKAGSEGAPFSIPGTMLPMSAEELLAKILQYHEKLSPKTETESRT